MGANPQIQENLEAQARKRHTWDSHRDWSNPSEEGHREVGVATQRGANPFSRTTWGGDTFRLGLASRNQQEPMEKMFCQLPSDCCVGHTHRKKAAAGEAGNCGGG